jgi:hypothetical protein
LILPFLNVRYDKNLSWEFKKLFFPMGDGTSVKAVNKTNIFNFSSDKERKNCLHYVHAKSCAFLALELKD